MKALIANTPDMPRAAPIRQDSGRPHVHPANQTEGLTFMMSQPLADLTFSDADQAELAPIVETCYREALVYLEQADRLREAAGLPMPAVADELYSRLIPRQVVHR